MAWTSGGDAELGREAVVIFHNYCANNFSSYTLRLEELIASTEAQKGGRFFLEGMGMVIRETELSSSKVEDAMIALAKQGRGRIPDNWNTWIRVLGDEAAKVDWLDATAYTATETAKDLAKGAAQVGDVVLDTAKSIGVIAPLAITAALLFILYRKAKTI